jgi:geranylgeranyl diphosphate synthase type II
LKRAGRRPGRAARRAREPRAAHRSRPARSAPAAPAFPGNAAQVARARAFDRYFARALPPATATPQRLHAAMRYGALAPGKRVRPLLALAACEAVGAPWRRALAAAAALECVHAFSLMHDDLPMLDDDDFRRGRPTTHKRFGDAVALLAGDALLAHAFECLAALGRAGVSPARIAEASRRLARASGSRDLVGGQVLDLEGEGRRLDARAVRAMHRRKTGALLGASLALGALAGGAGARRVAAFDALGRDLGLAFQIHDDLLNRHSSLSRLGKRAGTDDARGKATFPRAVGERRARAEAERLFRRARAAIAALGPRARALDTLVSALARRTH